MKKASALLLVLLVGIGALAAPPASFGRSSAVVLLAPGATWIEIASDPVGPVARWGRIVTPRVEVAVRSSPHDLFSLSAKLLLVEQLSPLFVVGTIGEEGIGLLSSLLLGPVELDAGRTWGEAERRWASLRISVSAYLSGFVGVESSGDRLELFAGARLFPTGDALWELGLSVRRDGVRMSIGGWIR